MTPDPATGADRRIRSLRPPKPAVDPSRPPVAIVEDERAADGTLEAALTIFLAGRECPFTCVFCDLWRHTLDETTAVGSLPAQIENALEGLEAVPEAVKLYNASNFFDPRAVPDGDIEAIVALVDRFERVTVESHPSLVGERCRSLAAALSGRLEVAMGLETANPAVLARLNKKMTLEDFERALERLDSYGVAARAFALVGVPFLPAGAQVEWAVRSVEWAASRGVGRIALIPVRGGNGELERLAGSGEWTPPTLTALEEAFDRSVGTRGIAVSVDTWDLEPLGECAECQSRRLQRLERMNLCGEVVSRQACSACGWS